jgi:hypothetical protein
MLPHRFSPCHAPFCMHQRDVARLDYLQYCKIEIWPLRHKRRQLPP